jgi:hypothetical protein
MDNFSIKEGTVTFWTEKGMINFQDESIDRFVNLNEKAGSLFFVKDKNIIRMMHIKIGEDMHMTEFDCTSLDSSEVHHFSITWADDGKQLCVYHNGKLISTNIPTEKN